MDSSVDDTKTANRHEAFVAAVRKLGAQAKGGLVQNFTCTPAFVVIHPTLRSHLLTWSDNNFRGNADVFDLQAQLAIYGGKPASRL
jgi:hypothetical protein